MAKWADVEEDVDEEGNVTHHTFENCDKICDTCRNPENCVYAKQCPVCGTWYHEDDEMCPLGCIPSEEEEDL